MQKLSIFFTLQIDDNIYLFWSFMQPSKESGPCNPHDLSLHKQVKEIADLLRPELLRLYNNPTESNGNVNLYQLIGEQVKLVKKEVTSQDALFAFQNILSFIKKAIILTEKKTPNQEILWLLQEVMAVLFKVQNLPS